MAPSCAMTVADDRQLANVIRTAQRRILFVCPAFGIEAGHALAERWNALGPDAVTVVVDLDPEVFRLGYGTIGAMLELEKTANGLGAMITKHPGIRIGVLIADDQTLVFAPTPQLIEAGPRAGNAPNAIRLGLPPADLERDLGAGPDGNLGRAIGLDKADRGSIARVTRQLEDNPPQKFDVARLVRVFNAYFEFVDFRLTHTLLDRRVVPLPADLFGIADPATRRKVRTTFRLIDPDDRLSGQHLQADRSRIAKEFLRTIDGYGTAIKRTDKQAFLQEVGRLQTAVAAFRQEVVDGLEAALLRNRDTLIAALLPSVMKAPPETWRRSCLFGSGEEGIRAFLGRELNRSFGSAARLVSPMKVTTIFKAVTYESLIDDGFMAKARKAFPELAALYESMDAAATVPMDPANLGKDAA